MRRRGRDRIRARWRGPAVGVVVLGVLCLPSAARATFHLWQVEELFSDAAGDVQFIELSTDTDFQQLLAGHSIEARAGAAVLDSYTFASNLPSSATGGHSFLIGTPDLAAAAGIQPDYVMPAGFLEPGTVDAVVLVGGALGTTFGFSAGDLPTDGVDSLDRASGVGPATPTNFAGETGQIVPEPSSGCLGLAVASLLAALAAWTARRAKRGP